MSYNYVGSNYQKTATHDDVHKWKHFPRYWPFVRGIHRTPVNSPHKGQWRGALKFSLICVWINGLVNNRETGDLRRHRIHYDVTVMDTVMSLTYHPYLKGGARIRFRQFNALICRMTQPRTLILSVQVSLDTNVRVCHSGSSEAAMNW